jgi:hypothetical protein
MSPALSCRPPPITPHDIPILKQAKAEYARLQWLPSCFWVEFLGVNFPQLCGRG